VFGVAYCRFAGTVTLFPSEPAFSSVLLSAGLLGSSVRGRYFLSRGLLVTLFPSEPAFSSVLLSAGLLGSSVRGRFILSRGLLVDCWSP
jgi:hypothetical protein